MKPVLTLDVPDWMRDTAVQTLMQLLNKDEEYLQVMFVGGCIRNWILQREVQDIDLATKLKPDVVTEKLEKAGIKVVPTGIQHGTVMAVMDGQFFEITTLRRDVETDGRYAKVSFTDDWKKDAERRDFTMNTLLADIQGHVYDPLGSGLEDAKAGRVVFVGDPVRRIEEDYLRIFRFFRFHTFYGQGEMDEAALRACQGAADKVMTLSRERITQEVSKLLRAELPDETLEIMLECNILPELFDKDYQSDILEKLCVLQREYKAEKLEARLFVLAGCQPTLFGNILRLSHTQQNFIIKLGSVMSGTLYEDEKALKKAIFYHGNELMMQGYLLRVASGQGEESKEMIDWLQNWQAPDCPITGESLLAEGFVTGPDLGLELKRRQEEWLERVV